MFKKLYENTDEKELLSFCDWHTSILNKIKNEGIDYKPIISSIEESLGKEIANKFINELSYEDVVAFYGDKSDNDISELVKSKDELNAIVSGYLDGISEQVIITPTPSRFDTTNNSRSLASMVEPLIGTMSKKTYDEIKIDFTKILNSPILHASDTTKNKWFNIIKTSRGKNDLMFSISNLYLKGAKLGVSDSFNYLNEDTSLESMDKLKIELLDIQDKTGNNMVLHEVKEQEDNKPYGVVEIGTKMYKVWSISEDLLWIEDYVINNTSEMEMMPGYLGTKEEIISLLTTKN